MKALDELKNEYSDFIECYLLEKPLLSKLEECSNKIVKAEICSFINELCEMKGYDIIGFLNCITLTIKRVKGVWQMQIYTPENLYILFIISMFAITIISIVYASIVYDKQLKLQNKIDHLTYERDTYYKLFLAENGMRENKRSERKWTFLKS